MEIYIAFFIINMLVGYFIMRVKTNNLNKNKLAYLLLTTIQFGLLLGFRATNMAYDTGAYEIVFNRVPEGWDYLFTNTSTWIEDGYYILCVTVKTLGGDFRTLLIITALFIIGSTTLFVYRHSKDVLFSIFLLICFPYYYTSFDIIRHYVAVAFFLLGYKYIEEKKILKYLLFLLVGAQFHKFGYLLILFYWLYRLKWNKISITLYVLITALIYYFITDVANFITLLIGKGVENYSYWVGSDAGGFLTAIMYGVLTMLIGIAYQNVKVKNEKVDFAVNATLVLLACAIIYTNARIIIRLLVTVIPLIAITLPELLCDEKNVVNNKTRVYLKTGVVFIGLSYHVYMLMVNWQHIVPYIPYWE